MLSRLLPFNLRFYFFSDHLSSSTQIPNFHDVSEHIEVDYSLNRTILHS